MTSVFMRQGRHQRFTHVRTDTQEDSKKVIFCKQKRESSGEITHIDALILNFQPLELCEHLFLFFKQSSQWYFIMGALEN